MVIIDDIMPKISQFIGNCTGLSAQDVSMRKDLVSGGLMDSLKIVELYFYIENILGDKCPQFIPEDFENISLINSKIKKSICD